MVGSQDINYALISALYANGTKGLYSDVYFPIIKYTIVQLFNQESNANNARYYTSKDVHDYILEKFRIKIPIIVISKSILKIEKTKKNFVELKIMEEGDIFQITRMWDSPEIEQLADREESFSKGLINLENDYKEYLKKNDIYDDGVTFQQFISDNTEEVLGYFQNNDVSVIDEKYTTIIFFLEYLHDTPSKREEFYIADQLFWASIIAGFLMSEKPLVDAAEDGSTKEYYLDTSILLGMLKLSTDKKEKYSAEIIEIIKASGGAMKVHPMTIEEIKNILLSVENATQPLPGTDIAEAWERDNLSVNKLASIRVRLQEKLELLGVQMFPVLGVNKCREITQQYIGRKIVEELARLRSNNLTSYSQDNFREIHDIFMDDYIKQRREKKSIPEDVVFVTYNRDLISFNQKRHPGVNYMMSTYQLVLDLWMHSAKPANISGCALTETMARCLDQHNIRVRNKIVEVSKFYNDNKGNFDAQVYQDFIKRLYQRARKVINVVEANPDEQGTWGSEYAQRIIDAVKATKEYTDNRVAEVESQKTAFEEQLKSEKQEKEGLREESRIHKGQIDEMKKEQEAAQKTILEKEEQLEKETTGRKTAEKKIEMYQLRDCLKEQLDAVENKIIDMEKERDGSFKKKEGWWSFLAILGIIILFCGLAYCLYAYLKEKEALHKWISVAVTFIGVIIEVVNIIRNKEKRREKSYKEWEERVENGEYKKMIEQRGELQSELSKIEKSLSIEPR